MPAKAKRGRPKGSKTKAPPTLALVPPPAPPGAVLPGQAPTGSDAEGPVEPSATADAKASAPSAPGPPAKEAAKSQRMFSDRNAIARALVVANGAAVQFAPEALRPTAQALDWAAATKGGFVPSARVERALDMAWPYLETLDFPAVPPAYMALAGACVLVGPAAVVGFTDLWKWSRKPLVERQAEAARAAAQKKRDAEREAEIRAEEARLDAETRAEELRAANERIAAAAAPTQVNAET